jgi:hypothetical protein
MLLKRFSVAAMFASCALLADPVAMAAPAYPATIQGQNQALSDIQASETAIRTRLGAISGNPASKPVLDRLNGLGMALDRVHIDAIAAMDAGDGPAGTLGRLMTIKSALDGVSRQLGEVQILLASDPVLDRLKVAKSGLDTLHENMTQAQAASATQIASNASVTQAAAVSAVPPPQVSARTTSGTPVVIVDPVTGVPLDVAAPTPVTISGSLPLPLSGGGCKPFHLVGGSTASTNATLIHAGATTLCHLAAINTTGTVYFLRIYDVAAPPDCTTATSAKHSYPVPANTSGAGLVISLGYGEAYAAGVGFCLTGGGGDTDNTPAGKGISVDASWR